MTYKEYKKDKSLQKKIDSLLLYYKSLKIKVSLDIIGQKKTYTRRVEL